MDVSIVAEIVASLREMVGIYCDEERYDVPLPKEAQPQCIQRAMTALEAIDAASTR